jgi:transposase
MAQPIAPDYGQQFLFPPALEDWVPKDHPARFLREFVDELKLADLGFVMPSGDDGRPPYAPSLLLKIWLYGYFHRIRSTRKLEVACREHLSLLWLSGLIQPDHNSLWRFWSENKKALREVFKQTVQLALKTGAVGLALQALDGTKIQAACSGPKGWRKEYMEKLLAQLDAATEEIENKVTEENSTGDPTPGYRLPENLAQRQALREEIKTALAQLEKDGRKHYHPAEPQAHRMKVGDTNRYGYNAQAVADAKEGIIVACEAGGQENDTGQLAPMIEQARQNVGPTESKTTTVADSGYGSGADLHAAQEQGADVLVPPYQGNVEEKKPYSAAHFSHDAKENTVTCPQGRHLDREGQTTKGGQIIQRFRCHHRDCPVRHLCTQDPKGRQVEIRPHTALQQAMRARLQEPQGQALYQRRKEIIERRFGQLKQHDGFRRWTVWGLQAVRTQWSILCTTLNLRILYKTWRAELANLSGLAAVKPTAA